MATTTSAPPSPTHLLDIAQRYWPSRRESYLLHETSPEIERLQKRWEEIRENLGPWNDFISHLKTRLSSFIIGNIATAADASLRCVIYPREKVQAPESTWVVVGCASILATVYAMYNVSYDHIDGERHNFTARLESPPPNLSDPAHIVAQMIEQTFGVSPLPREVVQTPVPLFVGFKEPPETTLFHALFTSEPSSIL